MVKGYFITGTDTEIGKTTVTTALLAGFQQQGFSTLALKPIASGAIETVAGWRNEDALALQQAATLALDYQQVNPLLFQAPVAPIIAAHIEQKPIDFESLVAVCQQTLRQRADRVCVEGVGGLLQPLHANWTQADLVKALNLPLILVVGIKLGCINHALLTTHYIRQQQLPFAGWIANRLITDETHCKQMIDVLQAYIDAPLLGDVPYTPQATAVERANYLLINTINNITC